MFLMSFVFDVYSVSKSGKVEIWKYPVSGPSDLML